MCRNTVTSSLACGGMAGTTHGWVRAQRSHDAQVLWKMLHFNAY